MWRSSERALASASIQRRFEGRRSRERVLMRRITRGERRPGCPACSKDPVHRWPTEMSRSCWSGTSPTGAWASPSTTVDSAATARARANAQDLKPRPGSPFTPHGGNRRPANIAGLSRRRITGGRRRATSGRSYPSRTRPCSTWNTASGFPKSAKSRSRAVTISCVCRPFTRSMKRSSR